jgi:hypothetical protein
MTNDGHTRLYFSGEVQSLPTLRAFRVGPSGEIDDARLEAAFNAENAQVAKLLEAKGLGLQGDEPGGVQIIQTQVLTPPSSPRWTAQPETPATPQAWPPQGVIDPWDRPC